MQFPIGLIRTIRLAGVFTRCAVVGSSVVISYELGVWDNDASKGSQLLSDLQDAVLPGPVFFYNKLPDFRAIGERAREEWNVSMFDAFRWYRTLGQWIYDALPF